MRKIPANFHLIRYLKNELEHPIEERISPYPIEPTDSEALLASAAVMAMVNDLVAPMSPLQSGNYSVMHYNDVEAHSRVEADEMFEDGERIEYQIIENASDDENRTMITAHYNYEGVFEWIHTFQGEGPAHLELYHRLLSIYEKAFKVSFTGVKNG